MTKQVETPESFSANFSEALKLVGNAKENVLIKVIKHCLGRDFNKETDKGRFTLAIRNNKEYVHFDGEFIGEIKIDNDFVSFDFNSKP